jgi:hypothetical protein
LVASPEKPFVARAWLDQKLREHWGCVWEPGTDRTPHSDDPAQRSWVVGSVVSGEPLLQTRPIVRDAKISFLDDFLRAPSQSTVAGYRAHATPAGIRPIEPARYARWACICLAESMSDFWVAHPQKRADFRNSIPDFIVRHFGTPSDEELLFMAFLAELHERTGLSQNRVTLESGLDALLAVDRTLSEHTGHKVDIDLWVVDGKSVLALHRGSTVTLIRGPQVEDNQPSKIGLRSKPYVPSLLLSTVAPNSSAAGTLAPEGVFGIAAKEPERIVTREQA